MWRLRKPRTLAHGLKLTKRPQLVAPLEVRIRAVDHIEEQLRPIYGRLFRIQVTKDRAYGILFFEEIRPGVWVRA